MAKTQRHEHEPTRSRRVRAALVSVVRASVAATACVLWVGLASPGLQLIPGLGGFGDQSISISLQSALLGIDDGRDPATPAVRAAMSALGLTMTKQLVAPLPRNSSEGPPSLAVQITESVRVDTAPAAPASDQPRDRPSAGSETDGGASVAQGSPPAVDPGKPAKPGKPEKPSPAPSVGGGPATPPPASTKSVQSITFTTSPSAAVAGGWYSVGASASSGLPVSFSVAPGSADVCTVSGTTVAFVGIGTCTIRANQAGNGSYKPAPQVTQSFAVAAGVAVQTISFLSTPPSGAVVGSSAYHVVAKATSGLPVEFGAASGSDDICTVTGAKVTLVGVGTCTINATQRGNSNYLPAPRVSQSFSIGSDVPSKSVQSINFTSSPPAGAVVGGSAYVVTASASSGLPVSFSVDPSSAGVCTLSGATVSLVGPGTCTIRAEQAGNGSYQAAAPASQSFVVGLAGQTISFTSAPPSSAAAGGPTATVTAAASSGLAVTFSIAPASSGVCSLSGSTLSFLAAGTCTVFADQAGNASSAAAPQVSQSFAVALGPQTISFSSTPPGSAYVGGPAYTVAATASSGLAVTFSSGSPSVCSVSGATVTFTGTGTCVVRANQPGNGSYQPAPQSQQSFTVTPPPSPQTITFTSSAPSSAVYLGPSYSVAATASSGLPVTFSVSGSCSLSGSTVVMAGAGTCTVYADQSGNSAYFAAPQLQQTFSIAKRAQTITFPDPGNHDKTDPPFALSATSSSGLAVTYTLDPSSTPFCSLSGNIVTPIERGDCIVHANQAGDANYLAAPQVTMEIKIKNHTPGG